MTIEELTAKPSTDTALIDYVKGLEARVQVLEDKEALAALMNRYCRTSDAKDWEAWSRCFVEDAEFDFGPFGTHHGRQKIREVCEAAEEPYLAMQHSMTNMQFQIDGDTATGTAYLWFAGVQDPANPAKHYDIGGPYKWTFRRTPEGWLLSRMHLRVVWTQGDEDQSVFG
ncbi:nuclear transport factor 2 family protein [Arthrobacter sp. I2-34]|uniref:Nuclear transport factor 2 family protein n=1 Tax=Arthrobacter hankyongi TaxID=2904801 RepID=A0ABS9LBR4_9MICC|nr:nuclear transport factor 2 family protein [Arthrobacter hankyongi]MCG2624105.1 nuclear transport factor 2 family protein [Arthrobacter hankyongi]